MASAPFTYKYFDFCVSSEVPLVELPVVQAGKERFRIQPSSAAADLGGREAWDWEWQLPSGESFLSVAHDEEDILLWFPGILGIVCRTRDGIIEISPASDTRAEIVRHLLLDHALPRLVSHQGRLVLHASAVAGEQGAILFLGQTGAGKSTIAASFVDDGFTLLTDDCVLLEPHRQGFRAIPAYQGLRLWSDSLTEVRSVCGDPAGGQDNSWKRRVHLEQDTTDSYRVQALVVLEEPVRSRGEGEVQIEPVTGSGAVVELLKHGFLLDPSDRDTIERQFLAVGELAETMPLFRLQYPRQYSVLAEARQAISQLLVTGNTD